MSDKETPKPKYPGGIMYVPKIGQPVEIYPTPVTLAMCEAVIRFQNQIDWIKKLGLDKKPGNAEAPAE